jgi:ankyrin repeat protein
VTESPSKKRPRPEYISVETAELVDLGSPPKQPRPVTVIGSINLEKESEWTSDTEDDDDDSILDHDPFAKTSAGNIVEEPDLLQQTTNSNNRKEKEPQKEKEDADDHTESQTRKPMKGDGEPAEPREKPSERDLREEQRKEFFKVCLRGDLEEAMKFGETGSKVNQKCSKGHTPLTQACKENNVEAVKVLLSFPEIKINLKTSNQKSPLMIAAEKGHIDILKILLSNGVEINAVNKSKSSALLMACASKQVECVKILIENGADVNLPRNDLKTPLMIACQRKQKDIASLLIAAGADLQATDQKRKTAKDYIPTSYFPDLMLTISSASP